MRWATAAAGIGILGLAGASLALPSVPTTDPWGWIVWGREVLGGDLNTDAGGSPSWKPLPVAVTALLALLGDAAPEAWLFVARALGLLGVVLAFLATRRLAGPGAGVVAAVSLVLAGGWLRGLEHGYGEPLVISALLAALLAWLDGRPGLSFALAAAAALARPELWPLAILVLVIAGPAMPRRALAWGTVALVPVLWIGIDWLGSGKAFNGSGVAAGVAREMSPGDLLGLAMAMPVLPVLVLAVAGALLGGRLAAWLGAGVVASALGLAAAVGLGYPGSERLAAPLMAAVCVLAGVGAARLWRELLARLSPGRLRLAGSVAAAVALAGASAPLVAGRVDQIGDQVRRAEQRAQLQLDLRHAARLARRDAPHARAVALPTDFSWARGAIAWEWRLPLSEVRTLDDPPRGARLFVFVPAARRMARAQPILRTRDWRVLVESRGERAGKAKFAAAHGG